MRILAPALVVLASLGCAAPASSPTKTPEAEAKTDTFKPYLVIRPTAVSLAPGGIQTFQAEINYPEGVRPLRQPVSWSVIEPGGGVITAAGVYTAPMKPGVYHVEALREDVPNLRVAVKVTVQ